MYKVSDEQKPVATRHGGPVAHFFLLAVGHLWRQQVPEWAFVHLVICLGFPKFGHRATDLPRVENRIGPVDEERKADRWTSDVLLGLTVVCV